MPFSAVLDKEVWCLYQPPLSFYNGWEEKSDELARSALVAFKVLGLREAHADSALVQVLVSDVIAFAAIGRRFPAGAAIGAAQLEQTVPPARRRAIRAGRFTYLHADLEGDVGAWSIVETRQGREHLVVAGEWGWQEDHVFAGNSPLDAEATQYLHSILAAG
jgi:hypothetical protein